MAEILHFVQNDRRRVQNDRRRVQNDKHGISLIATHSLRGEGKGEGSYVFLRNFLIRERGPDRSIPSPKVFLFTLNQDSQ